MVTKVDSNTFEAEVLQAEGLVVVDMYADWCGPCRMMAPIIEELSEDYDDVKFTKLNVDEADDIAAKYGVMSIPNFKFFKNGEVVDEIVGASNKATMTAKLNALL